MTQTSSVGAAQAVGRPPGRARPATEGWAVRDGISLAWSRYGEPGRPAVLLMPTWSIVDSRVWKAQIGYLSRDFDVITFDGRGCGKSDRPAEARYYAEPHPTDRHRASAGRPVGMTSRRVRGLRDPAGQPDQHRDLDPEGVQDRDRIPIGELR